MPLLGVQPESEIRQKNGDVQNELCENLPVHIAILAYKFHIQCIFSFSSSYSYLFVEPGKNYYSVCVTGCRVSLLLYIIS